MQDRPSRPASIAGGCVFAVVSLGTLALALFVWVLTGWDCSLGQDGVPYVDPSAVHAAVCHAGGGIVVGSVPLLWLLLTALGIRALVRWTGGRAPGGFAAVFAVAAGLVPGTLYAVVVALGSG